MTDTKAALPPAAPADQPPKSMGPIGRTLAKIRRWRANKFSREQPLQARIDALKIRKALCEDAKADVINQLCARLKSDLMTISTRRHGVRSLRQNTLHLANVAAKRFGRRDRFFVPKLNILFQSTSADRYSNC
jgi:hypothetical protein